MLLERFWSAVDIPAVLVLGLTTQDILGELIQALPVFGFFCAVPILYNCLRNEKMLMARLPMDRYGSRRLSRRQLRVIELVARGMKNREVAQELGIGEHVVRNYLTNIYDRIGVNNRVELALWYEARKNERKTE